ncbi:hypothetical protein Ddye_016318 [Dipteronia dyeriana]|uniref:Myb/SANT-like domain-containing protein n=1 Tax=Dipteronia dyeriana TaxID=168575 RepID=A0AAD9U7G1_9ROSI|nr:hypothetical protein Ddye_016318 [Dipteronia dyeriana]
MANEGAQGKAKAVWDPPTHEIWVDLAIEQVRAGNRNGTHLSKQGWKNFIENFNKIMGRTYDRKQLKNHWDNVKKEWQLWDSLVRGETGLGWDMERQTIDASNEWWEAKLQVGEEIEEQIVEQAIRDEIEFNEVHSGETMSRQFGIVLEKMTMFAFDEIRPPTEFNEVPHYIRSNPKYWPCFKDCIGAIDGTHVRVSLPVDEQIPYIDKYYLVDAGYPNMKGYLAPYIGERYHLLVFCTSGQPTGSRETFNYVHSSLRSVIERCFGVWKARCKILQHMPNYKFDKQVTIVTSSMALHNFIRREAIAYIEFESYNEDEDYVSEDEESYMNLTIDESEMEVVHDRIARELMIV